MKVLIIEDENIAAQRLQDMLRELDREIEVVHVLDSVESSVAYLQSADSPDLVFMDIELGDGQSFQVFNKVKIDAPVIFITAYHEHALRAFKQNSIDYLLKPLKKSELEGALIKYRKMHELQQAQLQKNLINYLSKASGRNHEKGKTRFLARSGTRLLSVPVENIAYFYTKEKLQYIKTIANEELLFDKRLEEIEAEVDDSIFFRANRQFIINYSAIEKVHCWFNGKLKVQLTPVPYEEVIISRLKSAEFKKWLGE